MNKKMAEQNLPIFALVVNPMPINLFIIAFLLYVYGGYLWFVG